MGDRRFFLAALQPRLVFGDPAACAYALSASVEAANGSGRVDVVVLPEVFDGRSDGGDAAPARASLRALARRFDVHVVGGSCLVREADGRQFNRCYVVRRDGSELGAYDKRVLFSSEARIRQAGQGAGVFELDGLRVGVLICADLWHPELGRELVDRVDVLAVAVKSSVPSESHVAYARRLWQAMALTRAAENGYAVVVSDWPAARHESQRDAARHVHYTSGATCIVDPSHRPDVERIQQVVADAGPGSLRAEVDLDALRRFREYRRSVGLLPPGG